MYADHPTPYPAVNALLHDLLVGAQQLLGRHFFGMYLEGSLASGDFDQDSDIDFVIASDDDLSPEQFAAVRRLHDRLATRDSWYADELEGFYVSRHALRRFDPDHARCAILKRGPGERLNRGELRSWWRIHLAVLREQGVTLAGPVPQTCIDPVTPQALQRTIAETVPGWATPYLDDPAQLRGRPGQAYVVLTLCRMLYTLQTGRVASKRVAARWALTTLEARWHPLIERAWAGRHNPAAEQAAEGGWVSLNEQRWAGRSAGEVSPDDVNGTLALIRSTIERSQHIEPVPFPAYGRPGASR